MLINTNTMLMSIKNVTDLVAAEVEAFRSEVEVHLDKYPMGIDYFGMKSARNPRLVKRLRDGQGVQLSTISAVRKFMAEREAGISAKIVE